MTYPFPAGNVKWSNADVIALICQPGYMSPDDWRPITGCAIVFAESDGDPLGMDPVWKPGTPEHLSVDMGLFRLNTHFQVDTDPYPKLPHAPSVSILLDPFKEWDYTWKMINIGRKGWAYNWSTWTTYRNGYHLGARTDAAVIGMRQYRTVMGLGPGVF